MGQLVELVLEGMPPPAAEAVLTTLLAAARLDSAEIDRVARRLAQPAADALAATERALLRLGELALPTLGPTRNVRLHLLRDATTYDLELSLDLDDVPDPEQLTADLHTLAQDLASRFTIPHFFAGLDPAADEDTRLFTGAARGPLWFKRGAEEA